jgi:hypothetical protein
MKKNEFVPGRGWAGPEKKKKKIGTFMFSRNFVFNYYYYLLIVGFCGDGLASLALYKFVHEL